MLHYERSFLHPEAEWLVFIHGAGGSVATWKYQWEHFRPRFNLLAMDLRDHGASKDLEPAYEHYSFERISADIKEVLDHEGIREAHFLTLSFGSVLLQDLSLRHPSLIRSAVMAGAVFQADAPIKAFLNTALLFHRVLPFRLMYRTFSWLLMPYRRHRTARKIYQRQAEKLDPKAYIKWVGLYHEFFRLLDRFGAKPFAFPALIVMGAEDPVFRASARRIAENSERAELHLLEKAGHICNIDRPKAFNEQALAFYDRFKMERSTERTR